MRPPSTRDPGSTFQGRAAASFRRGLWRPAGPAICSRRSGSLAAPPHPRFHRCQSGRRPLNLRGPDAVRLVRRLFRPHPATGYSPHRWRDRNRCRCERGFLITRSGSPLPDNRRLSAEERDCSAWLRRNIDRADGLIAALPAPASRGHTLPFGEHAREMTLIGKAARLPDLGKLERPRRQKRFRALDPLLNQPLMRRDARGLFEGTAKMRN